MFLSNFSINLPGFCHQCRSVIGYATEYLFKQKSVSVGDLSVIVAPRKFDVLLKTNTCPRREASRTNMLVLRISNFQGTTIDQTDCSET